jgi:hypothetical protein
MIDMKVESDSCELEPIEPESTPSSTMNRQVFAAELRDIAGSRRRRGLPIQASHLEEALEKSRNDPRRKGPNPSIDLSVVGMAFSGGGIRSSTFCFGVLQYLNEIGVIRHVDYLSTVSGGGYIGSMWSCFLDRSRDAQGRRLSEDPRFKDAPLYKLSHELGHEEALAFQHLRNYANYLMPRGIADLMRFPALLLRGLIVNFVMLLPYILIAACLTIWLFESEIKENRLGFDGLFSGFELSPYTPKAILLYLILVIAGTVLQTHLRRRARTGILWRKFMLGLHTSLLLALALIALVEYQPKALYYLFGTDSGYTLRGSGDWFTSLSAASGLLSAVFSVIATTRLSRFSSKIGLVLVSISVPLSLCFLYFSLIAWAVFPEFYWLSSWLADEHIIWAYLLFAILIGVLSIYGFDVNATSLHNYYRDSLSRTFLFCAKGEKIESADDVALGKMNIRQSGGPYNLINAVVNNPDLDEVNLRGRRAEFFIFGNRYTGNNRLGYCETSKLESVDTDANLGTAMAVSAAAAAPNMGQKTQNPFITFLMGMLNLRLGYWLPTPDWVNHPIIESPGGFLRKLMPSIGQVGPLYFISELFGLTSFFNRGYINLSDGGHLENLGIFELLRRRCEYIIAVDAEADPGMTFNGLATLIRLARTDMGIDIDIDTEELRKNTDGLSRRHWALGTIRYSAHEVGELLYIKSSVTGSENEYIAEYRTRHQDFPHQSTGDQFFDEEQFEAYRALGFKSARSLFYKQSPALSDQDEQAALAPPQTGFASADELFDRLRARNTATLQNEGAFFHLTDHRREIERRLCEPALFDYAAELNYELAGAQRPERPKSAGTTSAKSQGANADAKTYGSSGIDRETEQQLYQICNEQMQLMERALVGLRLDDPRNRFRRSNIGWMNLFRRWSRSRTFQRIWAASVSNYSTAFKLFCIEEFKLDFRITWVPATVGDLTHSERKLLPASIAQSVNAAGANGDSTKIVDNVFLARVHAGTALDGDTNDSYELKQASAFPVALAVIPPSDGVPVLTRFRIRRTYLSIGLTRQLLENLSTHPAMAVPGHRDRQERFFRFDTPGEVNDKRMKRILLHLGYTAHSS